MKKHVIRSVAAGAIMTSFIAFFLLVVVLACNAQASVGHSYTDPIYYYSVEPVDHSQVGYASYYSGGMNACGGVVNSHAMTAAHRTLPCGTKIQVTNLRNGKSVVVRVKDRGPFIRGRIVDLTPAAFGAIENPNRGVTKVRVSVL